MSGVGLLFLPLVFSVVIFTWRARMALPDDHAEKLALGLMVGSFAVGAVAPAVAALLPASIPRLEVGGLMFSGQAPQSDAAPSSELRISAGVIIDALVWVYFSVMAWMCFRVMRSGLALERASRRSVPLAATGDSFVTSDLATPMLSASGRIIIPRRLVDRLSPSHLGMIIAHERRHLARKDHHFFIVLALIDAVFWAVPTIRWQTARCRIAAELDCDRAACGGGPGQRRAYAELIVKALQFAAGDARPCTPAVFSPRTKGEFGMRLNEIMRPRRAARKRVGSGTAAVAMMSVAASQVALAGQALDTEFSVAPIEAGKVTSAFGMRDHPFDKKRQKHWGLDISAPMGTPIRAPAPGVVSRIDTLDGGYGNLLEVSHVGGIVTRYAQLEGFEAEIGDRVRPGDIIARVGSSGRSTGPHLHMEVFVNAERVDPETMIKLPARGR